MEINFKSLTKAVKEVVISTHLYPDADGIGSQIALATALNSLNINAICVNKEPLLQRYKYLDTDNVVISHQEYLRTPKKSIDLFIVVDTNDLERIGEDMAQIAKQAKRILFIDHHPCTDELKQNHYIDTKAAATGELVGNVIEQLGIPFTAQLALPLYTAIVIDTSSFRYPTVTGNTHRLIAKLIDTGIRPPSAYYNIYGTKQLSHMKLLGQLLQTASITDDGQIAWISLTQDLIEQFNVDYEDTHAFINHLLILDKIKIACMFFELGQVVKVSFRSDGEADVGTIAKKMGGGGHNYSAATFIEGKLSQVINTTLATLTKFLMN